MEQKQIFSSGTTDPDGQGPAINYNRVFVVLPVDAKTNQFEGDYAVLKGKIPQDPRNPERPERYCHNTKAIDDTVTDRDAGDGTGTGGGIRRPVFMSCTGDPNCNGGPLPSKSTRTSTGGSRDMTSGSDRPDPGPFEAFTPGPCTILLKDTVDWSTDYPSYLCDPKNAGRAPFPVQAGTSRADLDPWLTGYCAAVGILPEDVAFHIYELPLSPKLLLSKPAGVDASAAKDGLWLIAIPVLHASAMPEFGKLAA